MILVLPLWHVSIINRSRTRCERRCTPILALQAAPPGAVCLHAQEGACKQTTPAILAPQCNSDRAEAIGRRFRLILDWVAGWPATTNLDRLRQYGSRFLLTPGAQGGGVAPREDSHGGQILQCTCAAACASASFLS